MAICLPCRSGNHSLCLDPLGCVCQHRPAPIDPSVPTGEDAMHDPATTHESESNA